MMEAPLEEYAYQLFTGLFWIFLVCGVWLLIVTLYIWLRLARQRPEWRLSWGQAMKDLSLPAFGFLATTMVHTFDPSMRWINYLGTLGTVLTAELAVRYIKRGELSLYQLARRE